MTMTINGQAPIRITENLLTSFTGDTAISGSYNPSKANKDGYVSVVLIPSKAIKERWETISTALTAMGLTKANQPAARPSLRIQKKPDGSYVMADSYGYSRLIKFWDTITCEERDEKTDPEEGSSPDAS